MNQYGHHVLTAELLDEFHIGKANRANARLEALVCEHRDDW
jgi:hypothetical protein